MDVRTTGITWTDTGNGWTGAVGQSDASELAGRGHCWRENAVIMKWLQEEILARSWQQCWRSVDEEGCCPSRSGMPTPCRGAISTQVNRPAARCRWPGRIA